MRSAKIRQTAWGVLMFVLGFVSPAGAVTNRFSAFDLWSAPGERNFFFLSSSENLEKYQFEMGLLNSYIARPVDVVNASGTRVRSAVTYAFVHDMTAAFAPADFWQIGVSAAFISRAKVEDPTVTPAPGSSNVTKFGDIRVSSRVRVLDADRYRFGLAVESFAVIPSGAEDQYLGEGSFVGGGRIITDYLITERIRAALNMGVEVRERVTVSNIDFNDRASFGGGLAVDLGKGISMAAEGAVATPLSRFFKSQSTTPVEFTGGVQWDVADTGLTIGAGGGTCAVCGVKGAKARAFLDVGYRFQNAAIRQSREQALQMRTVTFAKKEEKPSFKTVMLDLDKNCPTDPKDFDPEQHDPSCPKYFQLKEAIVALSDQGRQERYSEVVLALREKNCPQDPKDFDPEQHDPSCPKLFALKEALVTLKDEKSQETFSEVVLRLEKNCPANPKDFDPEKHDTTCPKYFELRRLIAQVQEDTTVQEPEPEGVEVSGSGQIENPIRFAFNNVKLNATAEQVLQEVCRYLKRHSRARHLAIEGHADAVGERALNKWISKERAKSVATWLRSRCPLDLTFTTVGKGSRVPLAPNKTAEGRAQNRRVHVRVIP